ncbi:hypothetical protein AC244_16005 [Ensifer adhaerens]|uniref:Uncharacterized protein n=1 Tax=Ensifer adhaerens TaxID=106592 RepID=A0A0L8BTG3_ENSAD|nr:hypothetical protein [Ensifer adhaerens]KOF17868.1 hypothetical protein AC244_16005 [Ensifer adhaerens]
MTTLLPIVEELLDAPDDATRARWLLNVPLDVLLRDQMPIRVALQRSGFQPGLTCLATEIAALCGIRCDDGGHPITMRVSREYARLQLVEIARKGALK